MSRLRLMEEIRRRILALPQRPDEIGIAGTSEQEIAHLYERLGDRIAAGDWWIKSAAEAEKYGQVVIAHERLAIGVKRLPEHLGLRRELARLEAVLRRSSTS